MTENSSSEEMSFLEHLGELRTRLLRIIYYVIAAAIFAFFFIEPLYFFVTVPFHQTFQDSVLIGTGPAEAFLTKLKLAVFFGLIFGSPGVFYEIWKFISPGLLKNEVKLLVPFVAVSTLLFLFGVSFCFYVVFPFALDFFQQEYKALGLTSTIRVSEYFTFALRLAIVFGLIFELPVLCFALAKLGLLKTKWLIDNGRYAVLGCFIVAAVLTPPDPISQMLLAGPLILMYGICILITSWIEKQKETSRELVS